MILVIAEQRDGKLNRASWEAIAAAQQLARRGQGGRAQAASVLRGGRRSRADWRLRASRKSYARARGARAVHARRHGRARRRIARSHRRYVLLPHTYQTRDFAPKLAAALDRALVTDVTADQKLGRRARASCGRCSRASSPPTSCRKARRRTS